MFCNSDSQIAFIAKTHLLCSAIWTRLLPKARIQMILTICTTIIDHVKSWTQQIEASIGYIGIKALLALLKVSFLMQEAGCTRLPPLMEINVTT